MGAAPVDVDEVVRTYFPLADWWANRIQWCEDDHQDLVQEGMLSLVSTLRGYNKSGKEIRDLAALAGTCFSAAMKWWYKKSDRTLSFTGLESVKASVDTRDTYLSSVYVDEFLSELEKVQGPIARKVVEQLIQPSEELGQVALASMEKKRQLKASGERVIGYGSPRVHQHHIRDSLGLDAKQWDRTLSDIKSFTKEYTCREAERKSGHTKRESSVQPLS
jgi:DNA-directed RNA polymerase specialized sigma24 family protein